MEFDDYEALPSSSTLSQHMLAGACAGIMEHIVMYPVDCVKTRMQCLRPINGSTYPTLFSSLYRLICQEGWSASVKGSGAVIWGAGPAHAAYFGCYEKIKSMVASLHNGSPHINYTIAGVCATLLHDAVMTPADAVKQRLQMYNSPYHNCFDCLRRVCVNEGIGLLYRAYFTQLSMNIPYQTVHFVCYEHAQKLLNPNKEYMPWTHIISGGIAGCLAAATTNPLDVCKTLINTQERCMLTGATQRHIPKDTNPEIRGLLHTISIIYKLNGMSGFTRGMSARILTAVPGTALSWSVYEYFKWRLFQSSKPPDISGSGGNGGPFSIDIATRDKLLSSINSKWISNSNEIACNSSISGVHTTIQRGN